MKLYPVKTKMIKPGDDTVKAIMEALKKQNLALRNNDVLVLTSKIISYAENRLVKLSQIEPSEKAKQLAEQYSLQPQFVELILREAERIYCGVQKALLTLKNGILAANAGIDNKNAPSGCAVLWPTNPVESVSRIQTEIQKKSGKRVAVMIIDSALMPLRMGTTAVAMAVAGFEPVKDTRGDKDLYGKPLIITRHAIADNLASAAHLLMGEAAESTPAVLIRDAPIKPSRGIYDSRDMMMPLDECIFLSGFGHLQTIKGNRERARNNI